MLAHSLPFPDTTTLAPAASAPALSRPERVARLAALCTAKVQRRREDYFKALDEPRPASPVALLMCAEALAQRMAAQDLRRLVAAAKACRPAQRGLYLIDHVLATEAQIVASLDLDPVRVLTESDTASAPMPTLNPISPALDPAYGAAITEMMVRNHRLVRAARKLRALGRVFRSVTPD